MKEVFFFCFLCFGILSKGQSPYSTSEDTITALLKITFPEGLNFVLHEYKEASTTGQLSYQFFSPEISILKDTLFVSYIQVIKESDTQVSIERVDQIIPFSDIEEIETFTFTFGATDRFEPTLTYLGFWMKEGRESKVTTFGIPANLWNTGNYRLGDLEVLHTEHMYVARFPFMISEQKLHTLKNYFKTLQSN